MVFAEHPHLLTCTALFWPVLELLLVTCTISRCTEQHYRTPADFSAEMQCSLSPGLSSRDPAVFQESSMGGPSYPGGIAAWMQSQG